MKLSFLGAAFGVSLLSVALAGCSGPSDPTSTDASNGAASGNAATTGAATGNTATTSTMGAVSGQPFRVAFNQWIGYSGVMLARDKGYFKAAGLDVEFKEFSGPADGVPPLITGQLEAALTTADTPILLSRAGSDTSLQDVYAIDTSNGADGIVAGKGITKLSDLKGKTIAATKGQVNEFLLLKALELNGLKPDDVTITNMDADTGGAAVLAGRVPAAVTWEPWLSKAAGAGGSVIFSSKQVPNLIVDVAAVSGKVATERPADVKAFVAACAKGNAEAIAHPDEAATVAAKYLGAKSGEAKGMLQKVKLYNAADNVTLMGTASKPGTLAQTSKGIADFFVAQKVLKDPPAQSDLFTPQFLPSAT